MASLGRIIGPITGTILYQMLGPRVPFYASALFVLTALLVIFPLRKATSPDQISTNRDSEQVS